MARAGGPKQLLPGAHPAGGPPMCGAAGAALFRRPGGHGAAAAGPRTALAGDLDRLRAPARIWPGGAKRFLMAYFPLPPEGGPALLPYARRPRQAHAQGVAQAEEQQPRRQGEGRGSVGARCEEHGSPSCGCCLQLGYGISRCCRAGHAGHRAPGHAPPPRNGGARAGRCWHQRPGRHGQTRCPRGWGRPDLRLQRCRRQKGRHSGPVDRSRGG